MRAVLHLNIPATAYQFALKFLRFCAVGTSGLAVDMACFYVLSAPWALHLNLPLSKTLAAELALVNNFIWNELWTFRDLASRNRSWKAKTIRLGKFNAICVLGIGLSVLLLELQVRAFHENPYLANLVAICIVSVWNFVLNLKFGWR